MSEVICKCERQITIGSSGTMFEADQEPYKADEFVDVTDKEESIIVGLNFYMTATLCMKCKKVYFWSEDGKSIGIQKIE